MVRDYQMVVQFYVQKLSCLFESFVESYVGIAWAEGARRVIVSHNDATSGASHGMTKYNARVHQSEMYPALTDAAFCSQCFGMIENQDPNLLLLQTQQIVLD